MALAFRNQGARFIRDFSTNVTTAPRNAFVDGKGRIVAFFDQLRVSENEMWVVIEKVFLERIEEHLYRYLYISETKIEPLEGLKIYWDLDDEAEGDPGDVFIPQAEGRMMLTPRDIKPNVSKTDFTRFRVRNRIPLQGVDFDDELILSVADEERISYLKGCYLGQEIIARVHYKGMPPKRLNVKMLRDCPPEQAKTMTSKVIDHATGELTGFVFDKTGPAE
jgi:tRNA-modifying protein YgfZ